MIYVDDYYADFGRMVMCHMMSDESLDELHEFADRLGLRRSWFQRKSAAHYDVCLSKRAKAIEMGAVELRIKRDRNEWRRVYRAAKELLTDAR